ncbi:MAG: hypothetical protein GF416_00705 [Candidatus Altiarchaeales archaeon]|nr:hypothetical protein [Candidatus Altiarchaeales archaeon]MBD3415637.1 hypothetical protein [Candidatus Altiarchaeales archaeon]
MMIDMSGGMCVFIGGKQVGVECLRTLVEAGIRPALVFGNPDDDGADSWHESLIRVSEDLGLDTLPRKKLDDEDIIEKIRDCRPEVIFCIGSTQILSKEVLDIPELGCLNWHPALLPKYRGRYSTVHAIFNGEEYAGVTLHWMDEGVDSGPIVLQERIRIDRDDTAKSLYERCTEAGVKLFGQFLDIWLSGGDIPSEPQDESQATYFPKGLPNDGVIDWSWSGERIRNFIRAMTFEPFPPASFEFGGKRMVVVDEEYFKGFE